MTPLQYRSIGYKLFRDNGYNALSAYHAEMNGDRYPLSYNPRDSVESILHSAPRYYYQADCGLYWFVCGVDGRCQWRPIPRYFACSNTPASAYSTMARILRYRLRHYALWANESYTTHYHEESDQSTAIALLFLMENWTIDSPVLVVSNDQLAALAAHQH